MPLNRTFLFAPGNHPRRVEMRLQIAKLHHELGNTMIRYPHETVLDYLQRRLDLGYTGVAQFRNNFV